MYLGLPYAVLGIGFGLKKKVSLIVLTALWSCDVLCSLISRLTEDVTVGFLDRNKGPLEMNSTRNKGLFSYFSQILEIKVNLCITHSLL
jgi:hypothetical protein